MDKFDSTNDFYFEDLPRIRFSTLDLKDSATRANFLAELRKLGVPIHEQKEINGEESSS